MKLKSCIGTMLALAFGSSVVAKVDFRVLTLARTTEMFLHDDKLIGEKQGLELVHARLKKLPVPVIWSDGPWDRGVVNYASVIHDVEHKVYRMWYEIRDPRDYGTLHYAESRDGLKWERPVLNIVEIEGSKANNVVFKDPLGRKTKTYAVTKDYSDPNPAARYKMFHHKWDFRGRGVATVESPDGLHWTVRDYSSLVGEFDTVNVMFWDDRVGAFVAFLRSMVSNKRHIGRATSPDGYHWSSPVTVHGPDENDPSGHEVYTPGVFKYSRARDVYAMVPAIYDSVSNTVMGQIGVSRDGIDWFRFRDEFLPLGAKGEWDAGSIYPVPAEVLVEGKTAVYYRGDNVGHVAQAGKPGIGLALMHEGGFAGWRAAKSGTLMTRPVQVRYTQDLLYLNAEAAGGSVHAELLDVEGRAIPGFSRSESRPLRADDAMQLLGWEKDPDPEDVFKRGAFRVKLYLENATVYGIRCKLRPNYR